MLLRWMAELGPEVRTLRPIVDVIAPSRSRLAVAGVIRQEQRGAAAGSGLSLHSADVRRAFHAWESTPGILMVTPGVVEIVAVRR